MERSCESDWLEEQDLLLNTAADLQPSWSTFILRLPNRVDSKGQKGTRAPKGNGGKVAVNRSGWKSRTCNTAADLQPL
jgi:hypothetical protein